jgi:hypothetical protein
MNSLKYILFLSAAFLLIMLTTVQVKAGASNDPSVKSSIETAESAEINALLLRLDEIKQMDKSTMNSAQKKELRSEVREIKTAIKADRGGVYLSGGALILVIVLLILLL